MAYEYAKVGISVIDADHARLIDILEKLEDAHGRGHRRVAARLLRAFLSEFDRHFEAETHVLRDMGCRTLDRRHSEFLTSRSWMVSHPLDARDPEQVGRIVEFARAWLFDHIARQDGAVIDEVVRRNPGKRLLKRLRLGIIPLRWRLLLMGAIPLAIMLAMTAVFLNGLVGRLHSTHLLRDVVQIDMRIGNLVYELQQEANEAIMVVGAPRQTRHSLDEQITRTNAAITDFHEAAVKMRDEIVDPAALDAIDNAEASLAIIGRSRSDVQTGSYDVYSTIEYYETIVSDLMTAVPVITRGLDASDVTRRVNGYTFLMKAMERGGSERMLGTSLLSGVMVNVTTHDPKFIGQLATEQETLGRTFASLSEERVSNAVDVAMAVSPMLAHMREGFAAPKEEGRPAAMDWSETSGLRLQKMHTVERRLADDIADQAKMLAASADRHVKLVGGGFLLALLASLAFLSLLGLSVLPPLHRLGAALRRLANGERLIDLPDALSRDDIGGLARDIVALRDRLIQGDLLEARRGTENADRLRTTLDSLPGIVFRVAQLKGEGARVVGVSRKFYQILGLRDEDVIDRGLSSVLRACVERSDRIALLHMLRRLDGGSLDFECRLLRRPGQAPVWVRILATPVETSNGHLWDGVALDVTDAKKAEMERRRLQDEFDRLHISQTTRRIAAGIGSELAQLWTPLRQNAEKLMDELPSHSPLTEQAREIHDIALRTERLAGQLNQVLDGKRSARPIAVVDRLAAEFEARRPRLPAGLLLDSRFAARAARITYDPDAIDHMVSHLVSYIYEMLGSEPGVVSVTTDLREVHGAPHLCITLSDDRSAMVPRTLSKVMQLKSAKAVGGRGEELSLAIVRVVVDGARGWMESKTTPRGGSMLEILLPVTSGHSNNVIRLERLSRWLKRDP